MWFGLGKGMKNFLCVLLGTGISTGIILNGEVYRGVNCESGEFGHTCIDPSGPVCICGGRGCLEAYASGLALAKLGRNTAQDRKDSMIMALADGNGENITAETVYNAASRGDADALSIFRKMGHYLGIGVSNLINLFNPECTILCGRVSKASRFFMPALLKVIDKHAWHISKKEINISNLTNGAVLGAAGIVLQEIYNNNFLFTQSFDNRVSARRIASL